jgi:hypothetical protein
MRRSYLTWLFLLCISSSWFSLRAEGAGARAEVVGGTVAGVRPNSEGNFEMTDDHTLFFQGKHVSVQIPYDRINVLEYGQRVDRRYLEAILISPLMLLSKKRKHFLTVGYTDEQDRQQALVFRVHKNNVRSVLAGLEAKTGRKVEFQDDDARRTGKG